MTVKRYEFEDYGTEESQGRYVTHEDYAALLKERDAMAVENGTIKTMNDCLSEELRGYESDGAFDGPDMHKLWYSHSGAFPATDAAIANIQADGVDRLIADMKEAALRATPGPWRRTSTQFNGITHGPFSFTKEDVLGHFAEKCNAKFVSECDPKNVLALIEALEQTQKRNAQLKAERYALRESGLNGQANTRAAADIYFQLIEECDIPPGGSLVQHVDGMRDRIAELQEQKDKWSAWAIALGAKADELESRPLCVKSNDAMREAAPLCVKLPDSSSKAFWSGTGKTEQFHPETYKRWVKEAIERAGDIAGIQVEVK
jgi:DNA-binding protein H-NS